LMQEGFPCTYREGFQCMHRLSMTPMPVSAQFFTNVLNKNAFRMLFSLVSPYCYVVFLVIFLNMKKLPRALLRAQHFQTQFTKKVQEI
jgi:hypothetical protein